MRLVGDEGVEPSHTDPESAVLPLDESPTAVEAIIQNVQGFGNRKTAIALKNYGEREEEEGSYTSFAICLFPDYRHTRLLLSPQRQFLGSRRWLFRCRFAVRGFYHRLGHQVRR